MRPTRWIGCLPLGLALLVTGCESAETDESAQLQSDAPTIAASDTDPSPDLSPGESFKRQLMIDAMKGLSYDTGRVVIDGSAEGLPIEQGAAGAALAYEAGLLSLHRDNDLYSAIRSMSDAVILAPDEPRYYDGLGTALMRKGKNAEAEASYRSALICDDQFVDAQFNLASLLQMTGRTQEALLGYERVLELDAHHFEAHHRLATGYYYEGAYDKAWSHVHALESMGEEVAPQFRPLLEARMTAPER